LPLFLSSSFFFFPRLFSAVGDWMSTMAYFYTWCGLTANYVECRSVMCCARLAANTGRKNNAKNPYLRTIARLCVAVSSSSQLRHVSTIGKSPKQQYVLHMSPQYMTNFGPLTAEIASGVWSTPANFNGFRVLPSLLQRRRSPEVIKLCTMFGHVMCWYTIYTFSGALAPR